MRTWIGLCVSITISMLILRQPQSVLQVRSQGWPVDAGSGRVVMLDGDAGRGQAVEAPLAGVWGDKRRAGRLWGRGSLHDAAQVCKSEVTMTSGGG